MNLRLLLPPKFRWAQALRWIDRAEEHEDLADVFYEAETYHAKHAREAIRCYLHAMLWFPVKFPLNFPSPEDLGSHPADELLYSEEMSELHQAMGDDNDESSIPCILCGASIPVRMTRDIDGAGLYCGACAKL